jgi:hypothetical protein
LILEGGKLEEEIESWKGFPWALRKEDLELWNTMIKEVREEFSDAVEQSGKDFIADPFFMALLLAQQKIIKLLRAELVAIRIEMPDSVATSSTTLDTHIPH